MRDGRPLVLVLEDRDIWAEMAENALKDKVEIERARDCEEAVQIFKEYGDGIDGMYIDAMIEGTRIVPDAFTYPIVKFFRSEGYSGPMVTASSEAAFNDALMRAGCDVLSMKGFAPRDLLKALSL